MHPPSRSSPLPIRPLLVASLISAAVTAGLTIAFLRHGDAVPAPDPTSVVAAPDPVPVPPWGKLLRVPIITEKPDEFIDEPALTAAPVRWHFAGISLDEVRALLVETGLPAADVDSVLMPTANVSGDGPIVLTVPDEVVLHLTPGQRGRLYPILARNPLNEYHQFPFTFPKGRATSLLAPRLAPDTLALVLDRLYAIGQSECFADLGPLLRLIPDADSRTRLVKGLTRQETLLLKLKVGPDSNVDALVSWWARGTRRKDLRSLLESLTRVPGGATIDIAHLMPGFPRRRIYTYPGPAPAGLHGFDCHYSSLNFFNSEPDDSFLEPAKAAHDILTNYEKVEAPLEFGDLILLTADGMNIIHSCVHIAEDVVFTKNGQNEMQPWVLMTLDQVRAAYPSDKPWEELHYRLKGQAE